MPGVFFLASVNIDILSYLEQFPQAGQTLSASESVIACGGKGANQAFACSQNHAQTTMLCKLGDDVFGRQVREFLSQRERIKTEILTSEQGTAIAQIFIRESDGQNLIVIISGANKDISVADVGLKTQQIQTADLLVLQLENNIEAIGAAIEIANQNKVPVLLNPAPYESEIEAYLDKVDVITPNETEASQLTGVLVRCAETAKMAADIITQRFGIQKIVITLGEQGVYYFDHGADGFIASYPADVVDTSGAGDAFNGAFAAHFSEHRSFVTAVRFANAYASSAVEGKGASHMPEPDLAYERLAQEGYSSIG